MRLQQAVADSPTCAPISCSVRRESSSSRRRIARSNLSKVSSALSLALPNDSSTSWLIRSENRMPILRRQQKELRHGTSLRRIAAVRTACRLHERRRRPDPPQRRHRAAAGARRLRRRHRLRLSRRRGAAALRRALARAAAAPRAGAPRAGGGARRRGLRAQHRARRRRARHLGAGRGQHHHRAARRAERLGARASASAGRWRRPRSAPAPSRRATPSACRAR